MRGTWNNYTLDGIANTDPNFNLYVQLPSVDALQEFKVQSGIYPAEFGRSAGQVNVSTKPGGNDFHGTLFEFLRNDALDAKDYDFAGTSPAKSPYRQNQFGFALGGPAWIPKLFNGKNKLFFMANYEGYKSRRTVNAFTPYRRTRGGTAISQWLLKCSVRRVSERWSYNDNNETQEPRHHRRFAAMPEGRPQV